MKLKSSFMIFGLLILSLFLITGCSSGEPSEGEGTEGEPTGDGMTVYTIGAVVPLTGEGAVYGLPIQRAAEEALAKVNADWMEAGKNQKLEVIFEDGKCNPKDGLSAAQNLVNLKGVKTIFGGTCSGETLGLAPFVNENQVLAFSSASSSPDVTDAGDYVFRNYPSDTGQVNVLAPYVIEQGYKKVAILSENTDYAQALRKGYQDAFEAADVEIVADEVVDSSAKDVRTEILKIKDAEPEAVVMLPQTVPVAGIFAKQWVESEVDADGYGNEMFNLGETLKEYSTEIEGFISPRVMFDESEAFTTMATAAECDLGFYCAASYDAIILLSEVIDACGDEDTTCMKEKLYGTQEWPGVFAGDHSFDENGDIAGNFEILKVVDGELEIIA